MLSKVDFFEKFSTVNPGYKSKSHSVYFSALSMAGLEEMHQYSINEKLYEFFEFDVFKSRSETERYIKKLLHRMARKGLDRTSSYWFVRLVSDDSLVGTAGLVNLDYERKSIEWGYGVDPKYWGAGYVLEIQEILKNYVFEVLGLNRLHGVTMANNQRTIQSVLAAGAKHEGLCRDYYCKDGVFIDGWLYSILAKDYFLDYAKSQKNVKINYNDVIEVFNDLMPEESISIDTSMQNTASWDSLKHLILMIELKERLGIDLAPKDIASAISIKAIVALINK